ncbi:uncharacterized protein LOC126979757 isoform X2 [Leptidea sinapis]|uniref:uncharacterized protein LOC126979757 isoform X2 n=1 Tax=Leptidea sinapis TaxID=189913 RepID=UPI0021C4518F|nr:uncharacterized protein LOC126979757 isoform X2 [Leptidea sinapis]
MCSMLYSEKKFLLRRLYTKCFLEKQAKLMRLKINRQHVLNRCEKLLAPKIKKNDIITETKRSRDRLELLRLAIDQRRNNITTIKGNLKELLDSNNELRVKLPRYEKRVSSLGKHAQLQRMELQIKINTFNDQAESLAELRRSRIRQLYRYIFPVYISYDASESIEDLEFVGDDAVEELPKRPQLHIVAPYINVDGEFSQIQSPGGCSKEGCGAASARIGAALSLAAQLLTLIAWTLDCRLPQPHSLNECVDVSGGGQTRLLRWVRAAGSVLCARSAVSPEHARGLAAPHALALAAAAHEPTLGSVDAKLSHSVYDAWQRVWEEEGVFGGEGVAGGEEGGAVGEPDDPEPPEYLQWPDTEQLKELSGTPPPAASLVTSAAASIASIWRGWSK